MTGEQLRLLMLDSALTLESSADTFLLCAELLSAPHDHERRRHALSLHLRATTVAAHIRQRHSTAT